MTAYISMIFALLTDPSVLAAVCLIAAILGFKKALAPSGRSSAVNTTYRTWRSSGRLAASRGGRNNV